MRLTTQAVKQIIFIVTIREHMMDVELIKAFLEVKDCCHSGKKQPKTFILHKQQLVLGLTS